MTSEVTDPSVLTQGGAEAATMPLRKSDLRRSFWRFFMSFEVSWNYERMQALGFAYAMEPVLRRLHPDKANYAAGLQRHLAFFNTSTAVGAPLILGSAISLEQAGAPASAEGIKVDLIGSMAGIGDTVTYPLYNSTIFTTARSFGLDGNWTGPVPAVLFIAIPYFLVRRWHFSSGDKRGTSFAAYIGRGPPDKTAMGSTIFGPILRGGFI